MNSKIIRNSILSMASLVIVGSIQVIFNIFLARNYSPDILGRINILLSSSILISIFVSSGVNPANLKFVSDLIGKKEYAKANYVFYFSVMITFSYSIIINILLVVLYRSNILQMLKPEELILIVLFFPSYSYYVLLKGMYYSVDKVPTYLKTELSAGTVFFLTLLASYLKGFNPFLALVAYYGFFSSVSIFILRNHLKYSEKIKSFKNYLKYFALSVAGTFSSLARNRLIIVLPSFFLISTEIGYFAAAFSVISVFHFVPRAVSMVITPMIAKFHGSGSKNTIREIFYETNNYIALVSTAIAGTVIIFSRDILSMFFGKAYIIAEKPLIILSVAAMLQVIAVPSVSVLSGTKYIQIPSFSGVISLIVCIISWLILVPAYGINGISMGYLTGTVFLSVIPMYFAQKHYPGDNHIISTIILITIISVSHMFKVSGLILYPGFIISLVIIFNKELKEIYEQIIKKLKNVKKHKK